MDGDLPNPMESFECGCYGVQPGGLQGCRLAFGSEVFAEHGSSAYGTASFLTTGNLFGYRPCRVVPHHTSAGMPSIPRSMGRFTLRMPILLGCRFGARS